MEHFQLTRQEFGYGYYAQPPTFKYPCETLWQHRNAGLLYQAAQESQMQHAVKIATDEFLMLSGISTQQTPKYGYYIRSPVTLLSAKYNESIPFPDVPLDENVSSAYGCRVSTLLQNGNTMRFGWGPNSNIEIVDKNGVAHDAINHQVGSRIYGYLLILNNNILVIETYSTEFHLQFNIFRSVSPTHYVYQSTFVCPYKFVSSVVSKTFSLSQFCVAGEIKDYVTNTTEVMFVTYQCFKSTDNVIRIRESSVINLNLDITNKYGIEFVGLVFNGRHLIFIGMDIFNIQGDYVFTITVEENGDQRFNRKPPITENDISNDENGFHQVKPFSMKLRRLFLQL